MFRRMLERFYESKHAADIERRVDELTEELGELEKLIETVKGSDSETVMAAMQLMDENERKCDEVMDERDRLRERLGAEMRNSEMLKNALADARACGEVSPMDTLESFPKSIPEVLKLAQGLWPHRIAVLKCAMRPRRNEQVDVDEAWNIIRSIATTLWDLRWGGDTLPSKVPREFERLTGFAFSPHESRDIMAHDRARQERTFMWRGKPTEFVAHVKGRNWSRRDALRCHIYLDDERRLVVVGYLGPHLFTRDKLSR